MNSKVKRKVGAGAEEEPLEGQEKFFIKKEAFPGAERVASHIRAAVQSKVKGTAHIVQRW